jgi:hypothetical protein
MFSVSDDDFCFWTMLMSLEHERCDFVHFFQLDSFVFGSMHNPNFFNFHDK